MDDRDLKPALRKAYRHAEETAPASELLWQRTRRALRQRGLLRAHPGRSMRGRLAAVAASAALGGFLLGLAAGRGGAPPVPPVSPAVSEGSRAAVERVQEVGTDYALALEALARSLEGATSSQVATGQQVLMAVAGAHAELMSGLAPSRLEGDGAARIGAPGSDGAPEAPLIWF